LHLFSFFNAHDSQVWSFNELLSSSMFLSQLLSLLSKASSVVFINIYF
jgi:hypothetical protein